MPVAHEASDEAGGGDDAVARDFWGKGVVPQGAADCAWGCVEGCGKVGVGGYTAGRDLGQEGVDALYVMGDRG